MQNDPPNDIEHPASGLRITLLGGFHVWVGGREVTAPLQRRARAGNLLKLLSLTP